MTRSDSRLHHADGPGHRAQAALRADRLAAVNADRTRLESLIASPLGQEVWTLLQRGFGRTDEDRLIWLNARNAWLEGETPADVIERCPCERLGGALARALDAALVR